LNVQYDNGFKIRVGVDPREALARQEAEVLQNYRDRRDNLYHSIDRQWEVRYPNISHTLIALMIILFSLVITKMTKTPVE